MIYIFYGTEEYLLQKETEKIIEKYNISPLGISKHSGEDINIENILEDVSTISMFDEKKLVIIDPATFLTAQAKKGITDLELNSLENYLKNPNTDSILLCIVHHEKLDERKKIVKTIKKYATVKECNLENNKNFIKELLEGYQIEDKDIILFADRVGSNFLQLKEEAEKLKLYRYEEKTIKKEDILALTTKTIDVNIFTFIDNIISKNKKEAIETYKEMIKGNEEPIAIIVMLANQFRIMYQGKQLLKKGYSEKAIADTLNIHPFRVKKALEKARNYSEDILLTYLKKLIKLDIDIKSGKVNKILALELFILGV